MSARCPRLTLADLAPFRAAEQRRRAQQHSRNVAAMHRVAARLPACVVPGDDCPVHNKRGAEVLAGTPAPMTTSTRSGGLDGCSQQSA